MNTLSLPSIGIKSSGKDLAHLFGDRNFPVQYLGHSKNFPNITLNRDYRVVVFKNAKICILLDLQRKKCGH